MRILLLDDDEANRLTMGGVLEDAGYEVADIAVDILKGADPDSIPPRSSQAQKFRVDARQLERWGMSEKNLPVGTMVYFSPPTLWQQHRETVIAASAIILIQAASIMALVVQILREIHSPDLRAQDGSRGYNAHGCDRLHGCPLLRKS